MTERLHRILEKVEHLPPYIQDEMAEQLEDWVEPYQEPGAFHPKSFAGAWANLPDADTMIDELEKQRHAVLTIHSGA